MRGWRHEIFHILLYSIVLHAEKSVELTLQSAGINPGDFKFYEIQNGHEVPVTIGENGGFSGLNIGSIPARNLFICKLVDTDYNLIKERRQEINFKHFPKSG